ncbi:Ger(x)C family spore germination protein [Bacillus sp. Marseille-Q3570]|uniref:Ger(x)C family spore germination protein n=1 Tax=Bacillus sp. Marseille-Q3570 TaxID=2963522 RepID=UPI0021B76838|nr:Ger(x)C family spore germination protein [Bacillus sp. Marseille-Q3570]
MKSLSKSVLFILSVLILTGCWDQKLLKDGMMMVGFGLDSGEDKEYRTTIVIRSLEQAAAGNIEYNLTLDATSNSLTEARKIIDAKLAGKLRTGKVRVALFGEELAKKELYDILDFVYRDPENSLNTRVAIVEGKASEVINVKRVQGTLISEHLDKIIESAEKETVVPIISVQLLCTYLFDDTLDFGVPLIIQKEESPPIEIAGTALIHNRKYTGEYLNLEESTLALLMNDQPSKRAIFSLHPEEEEGKPIGLNVITNERKMKVNVEGDTVEVRIQSRMKGAIHEYPAGAVKPKREQLNEEISNMMTKKAEQVIEKIQKSNCDYFGIGRKLASYHPETWKKMNWEEDYKEVKIIPEIEVEIVDSGLLD